MFFSALNYRNIVAVLIVVAVTAMYLDYQRHVKAFSAQEATQQTINQIENTTAQAVEGDADDVRDTYINPSIAIINRVDRMLDVGTQPQTCCGDQLRRPQTNTAPSIRDPPSFDLGPPYPLRDSEIDQLVNTGLLSCSPIICN